MPQTPISGRAASPPFDLVLLGGGLQNALVALAVLDRRPDAAIAMVESATRVGGNHTWSFHAGDVPDTARALVEPLVDRRWPGYDVAFPGFERRIAESYATLTSERLAAVVTARFATSANAALFTSARAVDVDATSVTLLDGRQIRGQVVIDARGPSAFEPGRGAGYQKFLGLELELEQRVTRSLPLLMDARVRQTDGFRFFYVLPLDERRVLVEDTYFSDSRSLDTKAVHGGILEYARASGLRVARVLRSETGVLPLPARASHPPSNQSPFVAGYAGGWFHPATGYSFPVALRVALHVARTPVEALFGASWTELVRHHTKQFRFGAWLNRLLFTAFEPEDRWNALVRFYRMPEDTIRRFYALDTTAGDRARLVCGRPPRGLSGRAALARVVLARGAFP